MAVIGLAGPHAIGKTTAVTRWIHRYPLLVAAIADNQWEATRDGRTRVREWKGTVEQKQALVQQHQQRAGVTVIESVRTTALNYFRPQDPVILVTCDWQTMKRVLEHRCEANKKRFNAEYWGQWKLNYESHERYLNFARKKLQPGQWRQFEIKDQEADWPEVDEYFGQLYRRLHNQIIRNRR